MAYFSDQKLLSRVRELIISFNSEDAVTSFTIAEKLASKYREYDRRKKNPFRQLVEKACYIVYEEEGLKGDVSNTKQKSKRRKRELAEDTDSDSFSSDNEEYLDYKNSNAMNSAMSSMYRKSPDVKIKVGTENRSMRRDLFVIDKQGNKQLKNRSKTLQTNKRTDVIGTSTHIANDSSSYSFADRSFDKSDLVKLNSTRNEADDFMASTVSSPMSLDATFGDVSTAGELTETHSIRSEKVVKKTKKQVDKKEKKNVRPVEIPKITFANIGGNEKTIEEVCQLLIHMKHPEVYQQLGVIPPRGFLLHGPPGCGKTLMAHAIAGELEIPFIKLAATEIVSGVSGESESKVRDIFDQAVTSSPCIVFIDEIDAITQKRENASKDMERRIVAQLLTCMDDLNSQPETQVIVIGATNREDSLDPALRRAGRFDREICMGIPDEKARLSILQVLCKDLRLSPGFEFLHLARSTPGFVGADLMALAREAAMTAVNRVFIESQQTKVDKQTTSSPLPDNSQSISAFDSTMNATENRNGTINNQSDIEKCSVVSKNNITSLESETNMMEGGAATKEAQTGSQLSVEVLSVLSWLRDQPPLTAEQMANLFITMDDFVKACKVVQPSAKREGFATIPGVTWQDIGALKNVREELEMAILAPVRHPEQFEALGITTQTGVLLAGPPGCGKTLLAKAVANESGLNFISVKGPELLNMYVGESERAVRQVFTRARNSAPCVIFFDELDALCPKRSGSSEGNSSARVVNQLLTEMDGLEERKHVFIMGATNRPDIIDPAVLRPGRMDKIIFVELPSQQDRCDILRTITKNGTKPKLAADVNIEEISKHAQCEGLTGADLSALVRQASVLALKEFMTRPQIPGTTVSVFQQHFDLALQKIKPSVSTQDHKKYERMKEQFRNK